MKKLFVISTFALIFMTAGIWSCRLNPLPATPLPALTSTPTVNTTPVCGFTVVPNNAFALTPVTPVLTIVVIEEPYTPTITPSPIPTPVLSYPNPPGAFTGSTHQFRTLAQFQAFFGNWVPPVDFSTQMVLEAALPIGCSVADSVTSVCEGPSQITVDLTESFPNPTGPQCDSQGIMLFPIAVSQSNLPIVWQITEVVNPPVH